MISLVSVGILTGFFHSIHGTWKQAVKQKLSFQLKSAVHVISKRLGGSEILSISFRPWLTSSINPNILRGFTHFFI